MSDHALSTHDGRGAHSHVFLGQGHDRNARRTWIVIALCGAMMILEIVGGLLFGSIALVADGLHMSTHAGALLLAALAYTFARRHADDPRFSFGTGKLGDLAGFTSAIVLAMIAILIGYESVSRLLAPVSIRFGEAIPIAVLGLCVNIASAWLLSSGDDPHHGHGHHHPGHGHEGHDEAGQTLRIGGRRLKLEVFEAGVPPCFRLRAETGGLDARTTTIETVRPDRSRQMYAMADRGGFLQSMETIPEPHAFSAEVRAEGGIAVAVFQEHAHGDQKDHARDNNMRAAVVHVLADAAVSGLVIVGLILAKVFGWVWMDPLAGIVGAAVIASWSFGLVRDTGAILLDMTPDRHLANRIRETVEAAGDRVSDLHLWRLGPGHLGAIVSVDAQGGRDAAFYRSKLGALPSISHLTVEILAVAA